MKHLNPFLLLGNGRKAASLKTEAACAAAIDLLQKQADRIEAQLDGPAPQNVCNDPDALADWRARARLAMTAKRETAAQIKAALELTREERQRQLVDLRLQRSAGIRKMQRLREANSHPDVAIRFFRDEARQRLSPEEYEDIWRVANEARAAAQNEESRS